PELGDRLIDPPRPAARAPRPVPARGDATGGQLLEHVADLLGRGADPLGEHDEGDPPQDRPVIAAMAGAGTLRRDQAAVLVEPKRRGCDPAAPRDLADREQLRDVAKRITKSP